MIKLYDFSLSPRCRKARMVLEEKGLDYEKVPIDLMKGEHKKPEYLAVNPEGKVPSLVDGDLVLRESSIIAEYINDKYAEPALMPTDMGKRALVRLHMYHADTVFDSALMSIVVEKVFKPKADEQVIASAMNTLKECFGHLEKELGEKQYLGGDFSLADICYGCWYPSFEKFGIKIPESCPKVNAWFCRMMERKGFKAGI